MRRQFLRSTNSRGSQIGSELFRLTKSASQQLKRSSLMPSRTPGFEAPISTRVAPVSQSVNGGHVAVHCRGLFIRAARIERAKLVNWSEVEFSFVRFIQTALQ